MQFGKDFDHWPTILEGPMVKILGGPKDTLALPLKLLGGAMAPLAPPVPPPLYRSLSFGCQFLKRSEILRPNDDLIMQ